MGVSEGLWTFNVPQLPLLQLKWIEGREEHSHLSSFLLRTFLFQTFPGAQISSRCWPRRLGAWLTGESLPLLAEREGKGIEILLSAQKVPFWGSSSHPQATAAPNSLPGLEQGTMWLLSWFRCSIEPCSVAIEGGVWCILKLSLGSEFVPRMASWNRQHCLPPGAPLPLGGAGETSRCVSCCVSQEGPIRNH